MESWRAKESEKSGIFHSITLTLRGETSFPPTQINIHINWQHEKEKKNRATTQSRPAPYLVGIGSQLLVIGRGCLFGCLLLPLGALAEEDVVDEGVLQQGQEDKHEAAHQVHVDSLHVGDLWQRLAQVGVDGGHGQHGGDPWTPQVARLESRLYRLHQAAEQSPHYGETGRKIPLSRSRNPTDQIVKECGSWPSTFCEDAGRKSADVTLNSFMQ